MESLVGILNGMGSLDCRGVGGRLLLRVLRFTMDSTRVKSSNEVKKMPNGLHLLVCLLLEDLEVYL